VAPLCNLQFVFCNLQSLIGVALESIVGAHPDHWSGL
jgi:hypothetical protein